MWYCEQRSSVGSLLVAIFAEKLTIPLVERSDTSVS
jgi:hypothetical protein